MNLNNGFNATNLRGRIKALAIVFFIGTISFSVNASPIIVTNSSWKITTVDPGVDAFTLGSFDDSGWQSATEIFNVGDFVPGFTAKAIWSSGGQFSTTETEIWGRSHFFLNSLPLTAQLNGGLDDDGDVYINGALVVSNHDDTAGGFSVLDLLPFLVAGDNLIAFSATDNFPEFGFNHQFWAQIDGNVAQTPVPTALPLMLSGLGALGFARRRSKA